MTRTTDGTTVKLSGGNWIGILVTAAGTLLGQAFMFNTRMVTVETQIATHEKRLDQGEARDTELRREYIGRIDTLISEIGDHK